MVIAVRRDEMAVQMQPSGASPCIVMTNAPGVATLKKMGGKSVEAYSADGSFTIQASYGDASVLYQCVVG